jgi:hypothetical protein
MCKETKPFQKQNERRETLCESALLAMSYCHSYKSTTNSISKQSIPIETTHLHKFKCLPILIVAMAPASTHVCQIIN